MFVKRDGSKIVILIDSKLGTYKPVFPLHFSCGDDQQYAELAAIRLNNVITEALQTIAREHYKRGFRDANTKRKYDDWADIPWSFE